MWSPLDDLEQRGVHFLCHSFFDIYEPIVTTRIVLVVLAGAIHDPLFIAKEPHIGQAEIVGLTIQRIISIDFKVTIPKLDITCTD